MQLQVTAAKELEVLFRESKLIRIHQAANANSSG